VASALAVEQLQGRLRIAPATVAATSEVQTADMCRRLAGVWGVTPLPPATGQAQAGAERRQRAVTRFTSLGGTTTTRAT
jgi:hypothetical protein